MNVVTTEQKAAEGDCTPSTPANAAQPFSGPTAPASARTPVPQPTYEGDFVLPEPLMLECGRTLSGVTLHYAVYGRLNAKRDNAVLICHALSGSALVGQWWPEVFAPGAVLSRTGLSSGCRRSGNRALTANASAMVLRRTAATTASSSCLSRAPFARVTETVVT